MKYYDQSTGKPLSIKVVNSITSSGHHRLLLNFVHQPKKADEEKAKPVQTKKDQSTQTDEPAQLRTTYAFI